MQGELEITTIAGTGKAAAPNAAGKVADLVERVPFLMLALDLPPAPLYKDALEKNIIPQVWPYTLEKMPDKTRISVWAEAIYRLACRRHNDGMHALELTFAKSKLLIESCCARSKW